MNLSQLAAAASLSVQRTRQLVARFELGLQAPGRKRLFFDCYDLEVLKQPRPRGNPYGSKPKPTPEGFFTAAQAAEVCGVSATRFNKLALEHRITPTKEPYGSKGGYRFLYTQADVDHVKQRPQRWYRHAIFPLKHGTCRVCASGGMLKYNERGDKAMAALDMLDEDLFAADGQPIMSQ